MRCLIPVLVLLFVGVQATCLAAETHYDRIHLSASAQRKVETDTLLVTFYAQEEGRQVLPLTESVNADIRWALGIVKKDGRFHARSSGYTTHPIYNANKVTGWRVRQTLSIEGGALDQASEILGTLQQRLVIQEMRFTVSPDLKSRTDDALIAEALSAFRHRADQIAERMGRKGYRIVDINLATSDDAQPYQPVARMTMMESASGPAIAAGEQSVQVTASGTIELE